MTIIQASICDIDKTIILIGDRLVTVSEMYEAEAKSQKLYGFGTNAVKVKSPIPTGIVKPNGEKAWAYFLDLDLIAQQEREKIIKHLGEKFNQPIDFVRENLDKIGVPILKESCSLIIKNPQRGI